MAPSAIDIGYHYGSSTIKQYQKSTQKEAPLSANGFEFIHNGAEVGKVLAKNTLRQRVESIDTDACEAGQEDAFFVADMGEIYRQHLRWKMKLKRVKPHYGMLSPRKLERESVVKLTVCSCQMQSRP